ncbi:hypothetical protein [Mucilaginibacter myungsuensis]|uniref:Uncharacterized protein n=1 Tax=Mucilaginibacter myungsuensis TaxID=649104 RepID=A0A929KX01_9SPHI|nr:hypothetical protein [Mucilaginibacter myungsuensis]MBE9662005.1 hypothetical protein [Mucilaginibacter myungsuensis]MDN3599562.1 hypothetical protein [Mucilaginibacter myungsuensis]
MRWLPQEGPPQRTVVYYLITTPLLVLALAFGGGSGPCTPSVGISLSILFFMIACVGLLLNLALGVANTIFLRQRLTAAAIHGSVMGIVLALLVVGNMFSWKKNIHACGQKGDSH